MGMALTERSIEVLHAIVRCYIESGEPVASRTIARQRKDHLSAATVRNIMADLADMGYLDQPHTSAGRVPTALAFRHFAGSIAARGHATADIGPMRQELVQRPSLEERAELTSHILTRITHNVGIVAAVPATPAMPGPAGVGRTAGCARADGGDHARRTDPQPRWRTSPSRCGPKSSPPSATTSTCTFPAGAWPTSAPSWAAG